MPSFFEHQSAAKKKTKQLILLYALCVLAISVGVYFGFVAAYLIGAKQADAHLKIWQPQILLYSSLATFSVIFLASFFKILTLKSGGSKVAEMMGGRLVSPASTDPEERRLLNIVEEMAIASGIRVPPIYILDKEEGINAFAAGFKPNEAIVAVSRGCLQLLNRDELQGVIAHEFSHIINGDMALNIKLIGILFGILFIALIGRFLFQSGTRSRQRYSYSYSSRKSKGEGGIAVAGLILLIVGYIGVFFATLIKQAVSRQREFLADASAVQFTRQNIGLANALKKIGYLEQGSKIESANAEQVSHMFFADGIKANFSSLFATHPPLLDRIKKLEPGFDGMFPKISYERMREINLNNSDKQREAAAAEKKVEEKKRIPSGAFLSGIGTIAATALDRSTNFLHSLPGLIYQSAHKPEDAPAVVYAMLLDLTPNERDKHLKILEEKISAESLTLVNKILPQFTAIDEKNYLSLLDICLPLLGTLPRNSYEDTLRNVLLLAKSDSNISIYEYTLYTLLKQNYEKYYKGQRLKSEIALKDGDMQKSFSSLLYALCYFGTRWDQAHKAYVEVAKSASIDPAAIIPEKSDFSLTTFNEALQKLNHCPYEDKEIILNAVTKCIEHDGNINEREQSLLRAICACLDIPAPPV